MEPKATMFDSGVIVWTGRSYEGRISASRAHGAVVRALPSLPNPFATQRIRRDWTSF
jgi:hypothetical protein